jgi:4-azaleucine resistance transporter AzlC
MSSGTPKIRLISGLFRITPLKISSAGVGLAEAALVQLVVNAWHIAYGLSMLKRFNRTGPFKYYLIFALTDETFALLSSLSEQEKRGRFLFLVALLDQSYWVLGSVIGAVAGSLLPFTLDGIGFALSALFVILMIEQILRVRKAQVFIIAALAAVLTVFVLPARLSLLSIMVIALVAVQLISMKK